MNVVLIPCFQRPEFLFYCIEQIKRAYDAEKYHYIFQLDFGFKTDLIPMIESLPFSKERRVTAKTNFRETKQSYSVLTGYQYAASQTDELVFMIEEDVMIARDFFQYHQAVHKNEKVFASFSTSNHNRSVTDSGEINEYYLSSGDFCSLGLCINKAVISDLIMPHACLSYYNKPMEYITKTFPNSVIGKYFTEQDGLIRRIQMQSNLPTAYPYIPRSFHAGFYGKNRRRSIYTSLKDRLNLVGKTIFNDGEMRRWALQPNFYEDSKPINLDISLQSSYKLKSLNLEKNPVAI